MVQTRRQTRQGAPPPPSVDPFDDSILASNVTNPIRRRRRRRPRTPSPDQATILAQHVQDINPPPPATLFGLIRCAPVLTLIGARLTGRDIHNIILAAPAGREWCRYPGAVRPLRCQNHPNTPMRKRRHPNHPSVLQIHGSRPRPPFPLCDTPADAQTDLGPCQGHALGYSGQDGQLDHGPDFMVCQHCVQKGWEAYSAFVKDRGIDLCGICSINFSIANEGDNRPEGFPPRQCTCLLNDVRLWLCTPCRVFKSRRDINNVVNWCQNQNAVFPPMHNGATAVPLVVPPVPRPSHWTEPNDRSGESYCCYCGRDPLRKVNTYYTGGANDPPEFHWLRRICLYCRKQRFITARLLDN